MIFFFNKKQTMGSSDERDFKIVYSNSLCTAKVITMKTKNTNIDKYSNGNRNFVCFNTRSYISQKCKC